MLNKLMGLPGISGSPTYVIILLQFILSTTEIYFRKLQF